MVVAINPKTGKQMLSYRVTSEGKVFRVVKLKTSKSNFMEIKPFKNKPNKNYLAVDLCEDGKKYRCPLHRLVLFSFLGPSDLPCNHKDGDPANNRLENLEFVSFKENTDHMIYTLKRNIGPQKVNFVDYIKAKNLRDLGVSYQKIGDQLSVSKSSVMRMLKGKHLRINREIDAERNKV